MNASIISIGTELLFGQITNTNTVFLSQKLNEIGINVYYHFTVGDNPKRLKETLLYAMEKSDLLITTGGLGPTQDDLTKETIARVFDRKMELHEPSYQKLYSFFSKLHRPMTENNVKQAYFPERAIILPNDDGTAPGFIVEEGEKVVISFPGPPKEMTNMFTNYALPYLLKKSNQVIHSKILRFFGIGESSLETELLDLITSQTNPTIAPYAKEGEVTIRITARAKNVEEAEGLIKPIVEEITSRLGEYIYSAHNEELVDVVGKKLMENGITVSLAESCTGGLICAKLTSVAGISQCLDRGIVTYSNEAKIHELGVQPETLKKYGAVSEETAREMVLGLKHKTGSALCLSVTGIAGPGGGTKEKPVGLIYMAAVYKDQIVCKKLHLFGDRERIRNHAVLHAMNLIRKLIGA
ncbi:competence/damage-inducible protein A [Thermotalea metallivorans]|uniref:Putative competence-damage inducible protein n=1 Tax=Thermotalea metallivorans TaxID=520762 RepID=A0A140L5I7_9FIRM|nr:competence/damage-inducible protein A [Thermotalea metallivorans]KXG75812.1 putative competence-damage inducible protein [Thermotalea metallivorans]